MSSIIGTASPISHIINSRCLFNATASEIDRTISNLRLGKKILKNVKQVKSDLDGNKKHAELKHLIRRAREFTRQIVTNAANDETAFLEEIRKLTFHTLITLAVTYTGDKLWQAFDASFFNDIMSYCDVTFPPTLLATVQGQFLSRGSITTGILGEAIAARPDFPRLVPSSQAIEQPNQRAESTLLAHRITKRRRIESPTDLMDSPVSSDFAGLPLIKMLPKLVNHRHIDIENWPCDSYGRTTNLTAEFRGGLVASFYLDIPNHVDCIECEEGTWLNPEIYDEACEIKKVGIFKRYRAVFPFDRGWELCREMFFGGHRL